MAFRFASLDIWGGIGGAIDLFLAFIPDMFSQFLADRQRVSAPPAGVTPIGLGRSPPVPQLSLPT